MVQYSLLTLIRWIAMHPLDSVIRPLNNWVPFCFRIDQFFYKHYMTSEMSVYVLKLLVFICDVSHLFD